jgi:alkanesulfonate monooxygenase
MSDDGAISVLGLLSWADGSEAKPAATPFDPAFVLRYAQVYEAAGFDRVLIAQNARSADSLVLASQVAACTRRLQLMIAHRPGFIAPTMAARMFATLDQFSDGRVGAHIITAANDAETRNDGDFLTKAERYQRSREYVEVLRAIWAAEAPIYHQGRFYRFEQGFSEVKPVQRPSIPIFWGGASGPGVETGGAVADVYAMGGGDLARIGALIEEVRAAAAPLGRDPRFLMSMRVILGPTEQAAWDRAYDILAAIEAWQQHNGVIGRDLGEYQDRRLAQALAMKAEGPDRHLWTRLTEATQGRRAILCLVGDYDQVALALLNYHAVGVSQFLLTGFDPLPDTEEIGRELIPRLKA